MTKKILLLLTIAMILSGFVHAHQFCHEISNPSIDSADYILYDTADTGNIADKWNVYPCSAYTTSAKYSGNASIKVVRCNKPIGITKKYGSSYNEITLEMRAYDPGSEKILETYMNNYTDSDGAWRFHTGDENIDYRNSGDSFSTYGALPSGWNNYTIYCNASTCSYFINGGNPIASRTRSGSIDSTVWLVGGAIDNNIIVYIDDVKIYEGDSCPTESVDTIIVVNNTYNNHAINFTSDSGQPCGYNYSGKYTLCGPTEDETPTITFKTTGNVDCKLWNESLNWTTLDNQGVADCATTGTENHTCTFSESLPDGVHTLYVSCKDGNNQINDFGLYPANKFNISIEKTNTAEDAIEKGINTSTIWPRAIIYDNQPVYVRNIDNNQAFATFDRVVSYKNQRWAFTYKSVDENSIGTFYNLSPIFYFIEITNITTSEISEKVGNLINLTKI